MRMSSYILERAGKVRGIALLAQTRVRNMSSVWKISRNFRERESEREEGLLVRLGTVRIDHSGVVRGI